MRPTLSALIALLACTALAGGVHRTAEAQTVGLDNYFKTLKRPSSPNTWLVAPADFAIKPDAVAPLFDVPVPKLRETFKSVVAGAEGAAVVAESTDGIHVVVTTALLKFKDDVRALFIPVGEGKSTMALYSASRVGYWDFGTNRRRVESWLEQMQAGGKK
jgi:uncharacterized protein (DUF1499 family)